jgi:hypothetical protein
MKFDACPGALAKYISNWHLIGHNEGYCSNTGYILYITLFLWYPVMDFARAPRRAPWTVRKKGSGCKIEHAAINAADNFMILLFPPVMLRII